MASLNFVGGEKGGVEKSVTARVLAQYFIDTSVPFTGFDTDRSHHSFNRFYADYASPVLVDRYEGMDLIAAAFEDNPLQNVIVDLTAQTSAPLAQWIEEANLMALFAEIGVTVNLWHVMDDGQDAVDLLGRLVDTYGLGPNYVVVKNHGRGSDLFYCTTRMPCKKPKRTVRMSSTCRVCTRPVCARLTRTTPASGKPSMTNTAAMRWGCWSVSG